MLSKYVCPLRSIILLAVVLTSFPDSAEAATVNELIAEKGAIFPYILDTVTPIPESPSPDILIDKD